MNTDRFFSKIDRSDPADCWSWAACRDKDGYGMFWDGDRLVRAHRYSYMLAIGIIPEGLQVLHRCDNPSCVNPDHLFLGTHADNADDRNAKGRQAYGTKVNTAKLSEKDVREIRDFLATCHYSQNEIAAMYGVRQPTISVIKTGRTWAHVA